MPNLSERVEDAAVAFILGVVLIGSVGFSMWNGINLTIKPVYNASNPGEIIGYTSVLDTTQLIAWGLILTFVCVGVGFSFLQYMRMKTKGKR